VLDARVEAILPYGITTTPSGAVSYASLAGSYPLPANPVAWRRRTSAQEIIGSEEVES